MTGRRATVRLDGRAVGSLAEEGSQVVFRYDPAWLADPAAVPVSLTIPLSDEGVVTRSLHPFFENLLPEGWLLELATTALKISKDDPFGLLLATCKDCVGAVEIVADEGDGA